MKSKEWENFDRILRPQLNHVLIISSVQSKHPPKAVSLMVISGRPINMPFGMHANHMICTFKNLEYTNRWTVGWVRCANSPPFCQHKFSMFENRYCRRSHQSIVLHNPCCCATRKQFVLKLEFKSSSTDAAVFSMHAPLSSIGVRHQVNSRTLVPLRTPRTYARILPVVTSAAHIQYSKKHKITGCWWTVCASQHSTPAEYIANWGRDLCYVF